MNDHDLGFASIQREIERCCASSNATVEVARTDPHGQPGNRFVWIDFGVGNRKRINFSRGEIDDCHAGITNSAAHKISEAFL